VRVVAVNVDRDPAEVRRFLRTRHTPLTTVLDTEARILARYDVVSMPTSFVVGPDGRVKLRKVGYSTKRGLTEIEAVLGPAAP